MKHTFLVISRILPVLLFTGGLVSAQSSSSEYPGGPALNRAPDFSSWTITCHVEAPSGGTPATSDQTIPSFSTMTVVKTKDNRSVDATDSSGATTQRFFVGSLEAFNPPGTTTPRYFSSPNPGAEGDYIDFSQSDFPECSWVTPGNYTGVEMMRGHKCLVYKEKGANLGEAKIAYVDIDTRLPIQNQVGGLLYTYEFLSPPTEMLTIPKLMQDRIQFEQRRDKDLSARPAQY